MQQVRIFVISVLMLIASGLFLYLTIPQRTAQLKRSYDIYKSPPLSYLSTPMLSVFTLGHKHVYDDFANIWLLQTLVAKDKPKAPERMMSSIRDVLRHRPKFETLYMLSCITMYQDFDSPQNCQEIILAGLDAFPQSWRLPMLQGYVHFFLLQEAAQAATFFTMAGSRPNAPDWVRSLVQRLLAQKNISNDDLTRSIQILEGSQTDSSFQEIINQMKSISKIKGAQP